MGRNQYWAGRVYDLCVYHMTGICNTKKGFVAFPWVETSTGPGGFIFCNTWEKVQNIQNPELLKFKF